MVNRLMLLTLFLQAHAALTAQQSAWGFKGGLVVGTVRSQLVRYGPIPGATLGPYAAFPLGDRLELQPELQVSLNGASYTVQGDGARWVDRRIYAQLPVSMKFFVTNVLNLQMGGQLGRLLLARTDSDQGGQVTTERFAPLDAGVLAAVGLDLESGLDLTLRYYGGVTPILADDDTIYPRNHNLQLTVGHRFGPMRRRHSRRR